MIGDREAVVAEIICRLGDLAAPVPSNAGLDMNLIRRLAPTRA